MKFIPTKIWFTVACCYFCLSGALLRAAEISVFAAASLTDALKEIGAKYEAHSNNQVTFNFAGSSTLARQIEEGAPADIFFSADEAKMDRLEKDNLIVKDTRKDLLSNVLVVVVPADSPLGIRSAYDLTNATVKRIALADPEAVPAGIYSRVYLQKSRLWEAVKSKVVPTENVRAALAAVESDNVEAGMVYETDAAISHQVKVVHEIPRTDGPDIRYPVTLLGESDHSGAAKDFLRYLDSPEASKVFERFGFIVLRSPLH